MPKITLNNKVRSIKLELYSENKPYFKINGFSYKSTEESIANIEKIKINCVLTSRAKNSISTGYTFYLNETERLIFNEQQIQYDFIKFSIIDDEKKEIDYEVDVHFENEIFDSSLSESLNFEDFYNIKNNTKILFSAPFGQGKTTYLKYFFDGKRDSVELFRLFPVNYSVSHNEDIFQYIKCEILLQLLEMENIKFDKEKLSHLYTLPEFAKKNVHRILAPFIQLIPKVGGDLYKIYEKLYKLGTEYFEYHDATQVDDVKKAQIFIEKIIDKEGSIFEDNFFSQLIRQLILEIKEAGKEAVLVIDDMDRIDPDHIFRILNVFAAHFDSNDKEQEGLPNKFGFDKIILVCDYHNLLKIFKHRYGRDTDYGGYINKFYSKSPFFFNNNKVISNFINSIPNRFSGFDAHVLILKIILTDLNFVNQVSLREILKLKNFKIIDNSDDLIEHKLTRSIYGVLKYLTIIIHQNDLNERFKKCINNFENRDADYNYLSLVALITLAIDKDFETKKVFDINYKGKIHHLSINNKNLAPNGIFSPTLIEDNTEFAKEDLYSILIQVIEQYNVRLQQSE